VGPTQLERHARERSERRQHTAAAMGDVAHLCRQPALLQGLPECDWRDTGAALLATDVEGDGLGKSGAAHCARCQLNMLEATTNVMHPHVARRAGLAHHGGSSSGLIGAITHVGMQTWPQEFEVVAPGETVAMPPPWIISPYDGGYGYERWGGVNGYWNAVTPPIAHFVGSPDKERSIQAQGWWHHDADAASALVSSVLSAIPWEAPTSTLPLVRHCCAYKQQCTRAAVHNSNRAQHMCTVVCRHCAPCSHCAFFTWIASAECEPSEELGTMTSTACSAHTSQGLMLRSNVGREESG
jgi:hypothetical protein